MTEPASGPGSGPPAGGRRAVMSDADRVRSQLMRNSLKALLDKVRGSRDVLPHLAALETMLGRQGLVGIPAIAPKALSKMCSQLASLPLPKDDPALLDLLSRLLDTMDVHHLPHQQLETFVNDSKLMVMEASHSDFLAASREQATTRHGEP